jgi:hypothetical protein
VHEVADPFVPDDFEVPRTHVGPGFRLEALGPVHNVRDHGAWMASIGHIRDTPGFENREWPRPMTLVENMADMEMHATEFAQRSSFTYSILDGDSVIGCVYIYPPSYEGDADVRSWVSSDRADMDVVVWREVSEWLLGDAWPFASINYAPRRTGT